MDPADIATTGSHVAGVLLALGSAVAQVRVVGREPHPLAPRDALMLAWLALEGPTPRERLAQLLWHGSEPAAARNTLRQRLFHLRRQVGLELVGGQAVLSLAAGVSHDLDDSDQVLGDRAADAGGELAEWLARQRDMRRQRVRLALVELCSLSEQAQDWAGALVHAEELIALEPLSEEGHRRVMRLHYLARDRAAALLAFDRCERLLKDEVGARPDAETLKLLATVEAAEADGTAGLPALPALPASVWRPPKLVGRAEELAALVQGWDLGQVGLLIGEAGLGKSRLLQALVAARPGAVLVAARPGDSGVPLASLARVLAALHHRDPAMAERLPEPHRRELAKLLPELAGAPAPPTRAGSSQALPAALRALWSAQAEGFAGLVIDDLQWADDASLELLRDWIAQAVSEADNHAAPPRWALACRPAPPGSPLADLRQELSAHGRLRPQPLEPLGDDALTELVDSLRLPGLSGADAALALRRQTGGNPMFLLETLKQAWAEQRAPGTMVDWLRPRPASVSAVIAERLERLGAGALALARVAAVAGPDFGVELAAAVLGREVLALTDDWQALEAAQVLRDQAFAHDLVFETVRAGIPAPIARHLHGRIAAWLEQATAEHRVPARIADHWQAAGQPLSALPWLVQAAEAAWQSARRREQIGFLLRRADILADAGRADEAFTTVLEATDSHFEVALDAESGGALCDRLDRLATGEARQLEAALMRVHLAAQRGDVNGLIERALACREWAERVGEPRLVAQACNELGMTMILAGRPRQAIEPLETASRWFDEHGSTMQRSETSGTLAVALDNTGRLDAALPLHEASIEAALAAGDLAQATVALSNLACNRIQLGDLREARRHVDRGLELAARHDAIAGQLGVGHILAGMCDLALGSYGQALDELDEAARLTAREQPLYLAMVESHRATAWWQLGQAARALQALARIDPGDATVLGARVRRLLLLSRLARERRALGGAAGADEAAALLEQALALVPEGQRPDLHWPLRIEQALDLPPDAALAQLRRAMDEADRLGHGGTRLAALVRTAGLAATIDPPAAPAPAREALALAETLEPATLYRAELWWQAGRALQAAGIDDEAREVVATGARWVREKAERQVPDAFRHGFLQRNPVNISLLAWDSRR